jgi:hypothetical protein
MILEKSAHPHEGIRALEAVWKRRIEQECAEAQRKGTREFVGTYGFFSFHLPPDGPLRLCALLLKLPFQTVS